jgi:penicillin-binding protein 1A
MSMKKPTGAYQNAQPPATPRRKKKNAPLRKLGRVLTICLLIGIITGCIVASVMTVYILKYIEKENELVLENVKLGFTTILYAMDDATGEYFELQRIQSTENRIWVDYADIPSHLCEAAIAIEDKRYKEHIGVDFKRTAGAFVNLFIPIYDSKQGGSTITQQLIKNITQDDDVRIDRKIREIFRAINLEKRYSKEQIMESYLNTIALGNGTLGVQAASNLYFGRNVKDLNAAESAALISITKNPTRYNPFTHPEDNRERQLQVLFQMYEQGYLTQTEYEEAKAYEMTFETEAYQQSRETVQSWFVDNLIEEVLADLMEVKGYTRAYAQEQLLSGGYRIYTTVDKSLQAQLEQAYADSATFPAVKNAEYPESAFVILGLNGEIKALVGSNREKTGARLFNRATQAKRHPGSTIKPIATYSLAVEKGLVNWSTIVEDSPILLDENDPESLWPKNYYEGYKGPMTVTEALQRSCNTVAVKVQQMITPQESFSFLKNKLGIQSLVESKVIGGRTFTDIDISPMGLGQLTDGVTPLEMAAAYQIFGNGGWYTPPHSYTRVLDSDGNVILTKNPTPTRVITQETATIMNKLLQMVVTGPFGTGRNANLGFMPVAGKTGTSQDDENQWFIGVTPYYVGVCWMGYDEPQTIRYSTYPPPIVWKNVMGPIHAELAARAFPDSPNVVSMTYCTESGLLATEQCTERRWAGIWRTICRSTVTPIEPEEPEHEEPNGGEDWWSWWLRTQQN